MPDHPPSAPYGSRFLTVLVLLLALFVGASSAQQNVSPAEAPKPAPSIGVTVQDQPPAKPAPPAQPEPESAPLKPITKAQAKDLFRSVDEILQFVSHDTGLPIHHKVKRKLITRDQVEKYVEKKLKTDKDTQRLERQQLVLKKFGLIPENYDLHAEFLKLLSEQVAAYYDSKTKTVNLLDWVQPELQRPVLAHELTHALQDQAVNLQTWSLAGAKDDSPLPDQQEQVVEEAQAARQNVAEGQAMLAMLDYTLAPAGMNVLTAPDVVTAMRASMTDGNDSPVLAAAPTFLRESLLMPYTFGLDFERTVLTKNGKTAAYLGALDHPPEDTLQIMEPEKYLQNKTVAAPVIPDLNSLIAPAYERYDFGGMGAFDIFLLVRQYAPKAAARDYYSHWRGGYYLAAHDKTVPRDQIALLYFSRWDSSQAAQAFAQFYSDYTPPRYAQNSGNPSHPAISGSAAGDKSFEWDFGRQGDVVIETHGPDLLILEGFDATAIERLRSALLTRASSAQ